MMKNSIKELTEGMQRLCAVANRIVAHDGEVAAIERDLLMEELRQLYGVALRMSDAPSAPPVKMQAAKMPDEEILSSTVMATMAAMAVPEAEAKPTVAEPEPVVAEPEPAAAEPAPQPRMEDLENNGNSLLFDEVVIEPEPEPVPEPEPIPDPVPEPEPAPEPIPAPEPALEPEPEPIPEPVVTSGQASLLDYLKRPVEEQPTVRTLGDTLGEHSAVSGQQSAVSNQHKVDDLRTVININDKFSFMSELFRNNMKAYNDFILRLNAIDNRDEALLCVSEAAAQYKWDEASLAVQSFYKIFDKKF